MLNAQHKTGYGLNDSPFYRMRNRKKLARLLRVSPETLVSITTRNDLYVRRWKHKKLEQWLKLSPAPEIGDQFRPIDIPDPILKKIQARIADLLARIAPPDFLFSPVKGRSYVGNAAQHVAGTAFWLLDVADYFPSCTAKKVACFFHRVLGCSPDVTAVLVSLTTHNGCLPQGSPCSPILAYYSYQRMWLAVDRLAKANGCTFSLYADDITISGPLVRKELIWKIKKLVHSNRLRLKASKEVSLIHTPAEITGVIVKDGKTYLPNRQMKRLAELKEERARVANPKQRAKLDQQVFGRIAQRRQVERYNPEAQSSTSGFYQTSLSSSTQPPPPILNTVT